MIRRCPALLWGAFDNNEFRKAIKEAACERAFRIIGQITGKQ